MKIAILGSHPATKMQAPFSDPEWKIWACSPHNFRDPKWHTMFKGEWVEPGQYVCYAPPQFPEGRLPRVDEWFEVHKPAAHPTRPPDYLDYVRELSESIPVWMRDRSNHPNALEYPDEEMLARFGPFFMTSSIALMMAKAIAAKPEALGLWGIMQASANEYAYQRPTIQAMLYEAHKAGINVTVPDRSNLLAVPTEDW